VRPEAGRPRLVDGAAGLAVARSLASGFEARAEEGDRSGRLPSGDLEDLKESGLLALMVPARLGGAGATFVEYAKVATAIARASGATALVYNMHASVTGAIAQTPDELVRSFGAAPSYFAARDRVLEAARDGAFYAVAMSERGAGARLSALTTTYSPTGHGFRIVGSKSFVTAAGFADAYLVAARRAEDSRTDSGGGVSYFLVPAGEGVVVEETWDSLGMRATGSHDVHLDVEVDPDALIGGVEGVGLVFAELMPYWLVASYAAVYVGVAHAAIDAAVADLRRRSLDHLPAVRSRIGRADAAVASAELAVLEAARLVDLAPGSAEANHWVWRAKLLAGDTATAVASSMLEAAGASSSRRGHPLERLYRDARCGALQPATSDVCADWLGLATLGRDPNRDAETPRW
jgi:alkylation response protein AidB-like acyl-CoA dehydrogenase